MHRLKSSLAVLAFVAGCYNPDLGNGPGFYCHADDNPACPSGQSCVNGRCRNAGDTGGDLGISFDGPHDFAMSTTPHDFAMVPHDFAMVQSNVDLAGSGANCSCASMCPITKLCVGTDCCFEDVVLGTCSPGTCTPFSYP